MVGEVNPTTTSFRQKTITLPAGKTKTIHTFTGAGSLLFYSSHDNGGGNIAYTINYDTTEYLDIGIAHGIIPYQVAMLLLGLPISYPQTPSGFTDSTSYVGKTTYLISTFNTTSAGDVDQSTIMISNPAVAWAKTIVLSVTNLGDTDAVVSVAVGIVNK
jgi:hypothetical protein